VYLTVKVIKKIQKKTQRLKQTAKMFTFATHTNLSVPMNKIETIKQTILSEISLYSTAFEEVLKADNPMLEVVRGYVKQKTAVQFRPLITLLTAKLVGEVNQLTLDAAISLELLHIASLIHEDVLDDTTETPENTSFNNRWTNKIAILSGDYILSIALICGTNSKNVALLKSIASIGMELSDGELLQLIQKPISHTSEADYFKMIRRKTAQMFATCTEMAAISANADEQSIQHLRNLGEYIGICYQLNADISDYFADNNDGKIAGNDIRNGKNTLPLIYAMLNSENYENEQIKQWLNDRNLSPENLQKTVDFVHQQGGVSYAQTQLDIYKNKAINELNDFADSEVKQSLIQCVEYAANKEY